MKDETYDETCPFCAKRIPDIWDYDWVGKASVVIECPHCNKIVDIDADISYICRPGLLEIRLYGEWPPLLEDSFELVGGDLKLAMKANVKGYRTKKRSSIHHLKDVVLSKGPVIYFPGVGLGVSGYHLRKLSETLERDEKVMLVFGASTLTIVGDSSTTTLVGHADSRKFPFEVTEYIHLILVPIYAPS